MIKTDIPNIIPNTDIFDIIFMKLELLFDRRNLYANNNRIKILYHRVIMNQANKKRLTFLEDDKSTGIILVWPSIYENQFFWSGLLRIYYELIITCLESDKSIFLVIKKERDINNDLKLINRNINQLLRDKASLFQVFEAEYDDIWIRDHGPQTLIEKSSGNYYFNTSRFNGYGNKYYCENDKKLSIELIKKFRNLGNPYKKTIFEIFNGMIIEPGNITFNDNLFIINKYPLVAHNKLDWTTIKQILKENIEDFLGAEYKIINTAPISGDDTNGHIDNLVRLESSNYLYYMATNDSGHPDFELLKNLKEQIMRIDLKNKNIIPLYHDRQDIVRDSNNNILPFSYLNYIRIGNLVIMPANKNTTIEKRNKVRENFKYAEVIFIDTSELLNEKGSLHCCSMNF